VFVTGERLNDIECSAATDLLSFFRHDMENVESLYDARKEVSAIDPTFALYEHEDAVSLTARLIDWLESRKLARMTPWIGRNGEVTLEASHCLSYLKLIEDWFASILTSTTARSGTETCGGVDKLLRFASYVANNRLSSGAWRFTFLAANPEELSGYASLVILHLSDHALFVCYDAERFAQIGRDPRGVTVLKQKAILHGLSLAQTSLRWYLGHQSSLSPQKAQVLLAPPESEGEACIYEYTVRALVSSARTRVRYLLGVADDEWTIV